MATYVIAEAGSCHDSFFHKAAALVREAKDCGADAVKFQYWSDPNELADRRRVPDAYREIYKRYQLPIEWLKRLREHADEVGIDFMCTAYLPQDVHALSCLVKHFKVASFEAEATDVLMAHLPYLWTTKTTKEAEHQRLLMVSMGMGAIFPPSLVEPFQHAMHRLRFLHCVSAYPAPCSELNLALVREKKFNGAQRRDGFSDHSDPELTWTGALAVATGATIIEAHIKLWKTDESNPDAPHAMRREQFEGYVRHIRFAETCIGQSLPCGVVSPSESAMLEYKVAR